MVVQDGQTQGQVELMTNIMDNLIGASDPLRSLPIFIAVFVDNAAAGKDGDGSLRDVEYDTVSGKYAEFISYEVIPAVLNDLKIKTAFPQLKITADPDGRAAFGCSSGSAAALGMAWFRPDLFRRVAAYSATLVLKDEGLPSNTTYPFGAWEYIDLIRNSAKKPLRIFHHASEHDLGTNPIDLFGKKIARGCLRAEIGPFSIPVTIPMVSNGKNNWLDANNRTQAALEAKGYEARFAYARRACHCDMRVLQQDMPNSLVWLWNGWVPNSKIIV